MYNIHAHTSSPRPTVVVPSLAYLYATYRNKVFASELWLHQDDPAWMRDTYGAHITNGRRVRGGKHTHSRLET